MLLVGINPGVMSATTGHHFAGPTNRFWGLLYAAGIVPEPITHEDDVRLPEWGIGMTNLVARPTPGIDDVEPAEYSEGWTILEKKIERFRPGDRRVRRRDDVPRALAGLGARARRPVIKPGFQNATVHGARLFVLPNPSGRNAHFSYDDMLAGVPRARPRDQVRRGGRRRPTAAPRGFFISSTSGSSSRKITPSIRKIDTNDTIDACCWTVANSDA